jgi:CelD/BcsL family acetyltransferase involved in cellulose biosynthesis
LQLTSSDWHSFWQALNINICRFFKKLGRFTNYRLTESYLAIPSTEAKKTDISPYLPLNDVTSLDDILTNCGSSHRANVRRRLRNASKIGDVSLNHVAPKQLDEILEMMFKTHIEQWASRGQNSLFMKPQFRSFFHKLARIALNLNKLHFTYVTVDEEIWHIHFGLTHRDSLLWYKPTFISRFSKHSPGIIHLALLIEDCIKKGIGEIDFGYGGESYKSLWSTHSRNLYTYEVLGNDPVLTFMRAADTGRKKIYHSRLCSYLRWKLGNRRA